MTTIINSATTEPEQINVLWLVAEDLSAMYLSMYGDSSAYTPNLNRLANEGVVYTNAYSVSGVCSPSRFSLATGVYPNAAGAHNMRTLVQQPSAREKGLIDYQVVLPEDVKMVSEILRMMRWIQCTVKPLDENTALTFFAGTGCKAALDAEHYLTDKDLV